MYTEGMKTLARIALFFFVAAMIGAQTVDRTELESVSPGAVRFENFSGPYTRIDTRQQIEAIGTILGTPGSNPARTNYHEKYSIIRIVDPADPKGFDSDIFVIHETAGVDNIRVIRMILSAYLVKAFRYERRVADALAVFITVYNAVYRKNMAYITSKYKAKVLAQLDASKIGIATNYREWAGGTQMLIPLGSGAAVNPEALSDQRVISTLRTEDDRSVDVRRQVADLREQQNEAEARQLAAQQQQQAQEQQRLAQEQQAIAQRQAQLDRERQTIQSTQTDPQQREAALARNEAQQQALQQQRQENTAASQTVASRQEASAQQAQALEQRQASLSAERNTIAADQQEAASRMQRSREQGIAFIISNDEAAFSGTLVIVDQDKRTVLRRAEGVVVSRSMVSWAASYALILRDGANYKLALVDVESLAVKDMSELALHKDSPLLQVEGGLFAVAKKDADWVLARFDEQLRTVAVSGPVHPMTAVVAGGAGILVQAKDGSVLLLDPQSLKPKP